MKKILVSLVAALSLAALATEKEIAHLRVADSTACIKAATKVAEWANNPMLGMMMAAQIAQADVFKKQDAASAGKPVCLRLVIKTKDLKEEADEIMDEVELEPCKNPACACKTRPMDGLLEFTAQGDGLALFANIAEKARTDKGRPVASKEDVKTLREIASVRVVLRQSANGLDISGEAVPRAGSDLAKVGTKTLSATPFAFAPANALCASAHAAESDSGQQIEAVDAVIAVFVRNGFKMDFLKLDRGPERLSMTLDPTRLFAYLQDEGKQVFSKLDPEKFVGEIREATATATSTTADPACFLSYGVASFAPKFTVAQRFEATLPEAKGKPLFIASVASVYSVVKSILPFVTSNLDAQKAAQLKPVLATLGPENPAAIATMQWREKEAIKFLVRFSKDEFKSLGSTVNVVMGLAMSGALGGCPDDLDDDDFDDDDFDDDED